MYRRPWIETVLAVAAVVVGLVTVTWPDWIEELFETGPDGGSGALESMIAIAMFLLSIVFGLLAVRDFRRRRAATLSIDSRR